MKNVFKRLGAYFIDIIIISLIFLALSNIKGINYQLDEYTEVYDKYADVYEKYIEKEISAKEYKKEMVNLNYQMDKNSVITSILSIACIVGYFGIFQYSQNGKTIGKRVFKLQVVKATEGNLKVGNYFIRCVILYNIIFSIAGIICVLCLNKNDYNTAREIISNIEMIVQLLVIVTMFMSTENRGLQDYVSGTKVIDLTENDEFNKLNSEDKKIIDGEAVEVENKEE